LFILVSLALSTWVHPYWYLFAAFVGVNLLQFGFSRVLPLGASYEETGDT
jgi:hypothetical protein